VLTSTYDDAAGGALPVGSGTAPAPGDWNGVTARDGSSVSLDHVNESFGHLGVDVAPGAATPEVSHSSFVSNSFAAVFLGAGSRDVDQLFGAGRGNSASGNGL